MNSKCIKKIFFPEKKVCLLYLKCSDPLPKNPYFFLALSGSLMMYILSFKNRVHTGKIQGLFKDF